MREKIIYYIVLILSNILICIGGAWAILAGMFVMLGGLFSKPDMKDYVWGMLFYVTSYLAVGIVNLVIYKVFKNKLKLKRKYFIVPIACVYTIGIMYTVFLML